MRSCMGGCVDNKLRKECPLKGWTINRCDVASLPKGSGRCFAPCSSFSKARARLSASLIVVAPVLSARYSRLREIARWMSVARIGVRIARIRTPTMFPPRSLSRPPPKIAPHCAMFAIKEIAPAMTAAMLEMRISLFLT